MEIAEDCVLALDGRIDGRAQGESEARTVIAAYRRWGDDCAVRLAGEFCFILWDRVHRRLLVTIDRVGSRSLAYFFDGQALLVASRALSLFRGRCVRPRWNRLYLVNELGGFWSQPPGLTPFEGIRRTRPGMPLILENGRLLERQADPISPPRTPRRAEEASEEFWSLLQTATRARFSGPDQTCLALSGGLDSSFVGAALASHSREYDAFSMVSALRPELDETSIIQAFRAQHRQVRWHPVACDDASAGDGASGHITDDPLVAAHPLQPARRELMKRMHDQGFSSVLDGDGGDELFGMSRRIGDLASLRTIYRLGAVIASQKRRRELVWRGLVVPRLPGWGRAIWNWREHRRLAETPPWMSRRFWKDEATRLAREQADSWRLIDSSSVALRRILEHPGNVGSRSAQRLMAASFGLEHRAPLLDRAIVDFVLGLPPELLWLSAESKPFLRAAGRGRLPNEILQLKKHVALHRFMRERALSQEDAHGVARLLAANDLLVDLVEVDVVRDCLRKAHKEVLPDQDSEALYALITTARWMQTVAAEYPI